VGVGAVRDAHDPDEHFVVVEGVADAVPAPSCGPVALELESQRSADAVWAPWVIDLDYQSNASR
jgi:hypothetical protein